jgi:cobalt-zinc-cadmium efflux system outer membrane protein
MKPVFKRLALLGLLLLLPSVALGADPKISIKQSIGEVLTLREVIAQVLLHNPELEAFSLEVRAREAHALQAGLYKNPNILFDVQDVFGSGGFKKAQQSQSTIILSQVIELGGKRTKRERAALSHKDLAFWDYEAARMNILTRVAKAYTDALTAQEKRKLAQELVQLSKKSYNAVKARVIAGKVSPIHEVKAQVALSTTQIQYQQAENNLKAAYRRLASFWGNLTPLFKKVTGQLYLIGPVPSFETLAGQMQSNPDLARWAAEMSQRTAAIDLEEANAVPNLRVGAGARWFEETNDNSFVVEFSIPIQLFDRNQGSIAEARHRLAKAKAQRRAVELKLNAALATGYTRLANAHSRVTSLKTKILPGARTAFEAVNEGYRFGKFGYLEVLDSQRTWFNARSQFLDALAEYHKAVADVERLTGQAVSPVPEPRPQPRERERQR